MGFQPPPGFTPRGPERGQLPPVDQIAAEVEMGLVLFGVMMGAVWGLAAGEAQVIIDRSLDISRLVVEGA